MSASVLLALNVTSHIGSTLIIHAIHTERHQGRLCRNKNGRESRRDMALWVYPAKE